LVAKKIKNKSTIENRKDFLFRRARSVIAFSAPPEFDEVVTTTTCSEVVRMTFSNHQFLKASSSGFE